MSDAAARGFLLQPTYRMQREVPVIQLFGRLEEGAPFLVEDDRFRPYFFVHAEVADRVASEAGVEVADEPGVADLAGRPVARVTVPTPSAVPPLRDRLIARGIVPLEADVRFPYRYLIDLGIRAGVSIEGEARRAGGLVRFRNPKLAPAEVRPSLTVLSLDLETSPDASELYSAALVGCGVEEVLLRSARPVAGARTFEDERALLRGLVDRIAELDPDVLTGWNVVDFDLRVLARRSEAQALSLDLGRLRGRMRLLQDPGFTRQWRADLPGRVVLDGIPLVRDALRLDDYRLETVARAVLGRGKKIDQDAPDAAAEITRLFRHDPEALVAYNLEDARLVMEILEREGLLALAVERSLLCGMPLDRVGASVASFDRLYLPALRRRGHVAPSVDRERENVLVKGGALLEPKPGLHERVAVFDFKSLYPSLIRTFHLDPLAHARAEAADAEGDAALEAPNGARFARTGAILPDIVDGFMASRERAKERGDHHADQALKIMMNALFGVLGTPSCRFFDPAIANAITSFGQQTLHWTAEAFEAAGVPVLYGDTDSVFVGLGEGDVDEPERLRARIEEQVAARIRAAYDVDSLLTLELERVFDRLFLPRVRGGGGGSKKRYAGWLAGRERPLVVVGLESVRRDWPRVTRRLQEGMLERLFRGEDVLPFVREVAEGVRGGAFDEELVYVKRVRKGSVDKYTSSTPPHIQAARKAGATPGGVIRYVITQTGPEPALPGRPLPERIDRGHYVERVLRPVADAILVELGQSFDEAMGQGTQLDLL